MNVLALNSGSSSIKFASYGAGASALEELLRGDVETRGADDAGAAIGEIARRLADAGMRAPDAIGHRIVHGGPKLLRHCRIDAPVLRELEHAVTFAPLHGPAALAVLRYAREHFPNVPQVACLDSAFHAAMPEVAKTLPLPRDLRAEGIRRYGFHGLSCESIVHQLAGELPQRLVIAHLGNGCSVTAVKSGASIDTSMGLTPTGGVIMGTRTGDLDPGALVYLLREKNLDASALEDLVDRRSGLLGISGLSSDMRRLREAASSNADARLAMEMFRYSVRKQVGAMAAALGGMDLLVFTGGIGENDAQAREAICEGLGWRVRVMATREEERIAFHVRALLAA